MAEDNIYAGTTLLVASDGYKTSIFLSDERSKPINAIFH